MKNIITKQFTRSFSQIRKLPEFKLIKFNAKSDSDYQLFRGLIIDNMEFSALQFFIPNIKDDIKSVQDSSEVRNYFNNPEKDKYLKDAYTFVTQNHETGVLGYKKVLQDGVFVGNTGWIMHDVGLDGRINKIERGIHLKQDLCSANLSEKPSTVFKPRVAVQVMKQVVEDLISNKDLLNLDGELVSSVLKTNKRSQAFTKKYKLNIGEPNFEEAGALKWAQKIGDFVDRSPEILSLLDQAANNQYSGR